MVELDRTQQRILGVLIEKEMATPEQYPLTENALVAGCNQKSNRDPEMGLEPFQVHGALVAMMSDGWAKTATSTSGARSTRYAHRLDAHFTVDPQEKAVLCELLVRGPQAPGALKPRVARLGFAGTPEQIEAVLRRMADKPVRMVEQLPRRPRERDNRWRHLLGPMDAAHEAGAAEAHELPVVRHSVAAPDPGAADLAARVQRLEEEVAALRDEITRLRDGSD
ncbi:MAG: DUF480 domain-containing protein [Planctomycetes bacterium]|nr:DUF480 domain-containing protein [Planctomycetota bacterium]MCB9888455.1 DUF480 domain-containing protein [Planctomycetota bacterium]